jgi:uridine kinase
MNIIGLSGISGAGKTHLLRLLKNELGDKIEILSSDNYYLPIEFQVRDENGFHNFDLPNGIDDAAFLNDILQIKSGKSITKKVYNFNNPNAKEAFFEIKPAPILIVEGLFIYHFPAINSLFNYKIFLQLHPEIALNRRLIRDQQERGLTIETIQYQWHNHTLPGFETFVQPYQNLADIIIDNQNHFQEAFDQLLIALQNILKSN